MDHLSPEQRNDLIKDLPVIVEIKEDIHQSREDFKERFDKGTKRMDSIEDKVDKLSDLIIQGNEDRVKKHSQVMGKLDEEKEKRFIEKLKEVTDENVKLKDKLWSYAERAFWVIVVAIAGIYGFNVPL